MRTRRQTVVLPDRKPPERRPERTDQGAQVAGIILEVADRLDSLLTEDALRGPPRTVEGAHGQGAQELDLLPFGDQGQPVGFLVVAGDLGQELVCGNADSRGQPPLRGDPLFQLPGQGNSPEQGAVRVLGLAGCRQVEVRFVNGHLVHNGPRLPDDSHDPARLLPVVVHLGPDECAPGAEPAGRGAGHRRADTILPGLVAGGADYPALGGRRPDNHRLAAERRIVALLDGGIKRIHVQMEDHPKHRLELARIPSLGEAPRPAMRSRNGSRSLPDSHGHRPARWGLLPSDYLAESSPFNAQSHTFGNSRG